MTTRNCANCACSQALAMKDGAPLETKPQTNADMLDALGNPTMGMVCRRNPPSARQVRAQRTMMMMKDGVPTPVLDKLGRPRTEEIQEMQIGWQPTGPLAVCYDGWRPEGTLPGISPADAGTGPRASARDAT